MTSVAEIRSPRLAEFVAYLRSKRAEGRAPQRSDIDPVTEVPRLAPSMMLVERTPTGRHRLRLIGTRAVEIVGHDFTGRWLDELGMGAMAGWYADLEVVFATDAILAGHVRLPWDKRAHIAIEWVAKRLDPVPGDNNMILIALDRIDP